MSGRPRSLQAQPAKLLALLRARAGADGRVPRIPRAEACGLLDIANSSLAAALSSLCTLGLATREEERAPEGMLPALRLKEDPTTERAGSGLAGLGIESIAHRRITGETISLARVRWAEVRG